MSSPARRSRLAGTPFGLALLAILTILPACSRTTRPAVVYQTDFGLADGAVSSMKGVARSVDPELSLEDLTHEIPPYDIWAAAYRLAQTAPYWPPGTIFVSVVDPGVGTDRRSVVLRTRSGHLFVSPDNGSLTLVAEELGIESARQIDESVHRREGSRQSHTFHGRDVYSLTAARIASGSLPFEEVGPPIESIVRIPYQTAEFRDEIVRGTIPILDVQYGNVWTNIDRPTFERLGSARGTPVQVRIRHGDTLVHEGEIPHVETFADVPEGQPLLYFNSLGRVALALNMGDFASTHGIGSGPEWSIELSR